jgi:hypothetical protein
MNFIEVTPQQYEIMRAATALEAAGLAVFVGAVVHSMTTPQSVTDLAQGSVVAFAMVSTAARILLVVFFFHSNIRPSLVIRQVDRALSISEMRLWWHVAADVKWQLIRLFATLLFMLVASFIPAYYSSYLVPLLVMAVYVSATSYFDSKYRTGVTRR